MTTTLCHHDGGTGIGAGHVCRCIRTSGHPLDSARPHGCSCGALWADEIQALARATTMVERETVAGTTSPCPSCGHAVGAHGPSGCRSAWCPCSRPRGAEVAVGTVTVTAEHQRLATEAIERGWPGEGGDRAPVLLGFSVAAAIADAAGTDEKVLDRARRILARHGHGIGATCTPACAAPVDTNDPNGENGTVDSGGPS